jgi:DNA-binding MarR family transcriptional regulator
MENPQPQLAPRVRRILNRRRRFARDNTYTYHFAAESNTIMGKITRKLATQAVTTPPNPRRLPILLRRAWFGLNQSFRRQIAGAGLTPGQFTALRTLIERGDLTQRELTEVMSSDPNTIASLLSRMEKTGWLRRETHERDRRANRLHVTAAGRRKFGAVQPTALELQARVLGVLTAAERERFLESLEKIADACQAELDHGTGTA